MNFLVPKKITKVVQRPKKKFVPPFTVTGSLMKKSNADYLEEKANKQEQKQSKQGEKQKKIQKKGVAVKPKQKGGKSKCETDKSKSPQPGTSGIANKKGGPINLYTPDMSSESDSDESIPEEDKCCVCKLFHPKETRGCVQLIITKWAQCDMCLHWVHLGYCTSVKVVRLGDVFRCPHCE